MSLAPGPITVVKLGGSLLTWPEWPARLVAFLASRSDEQVVLIVGGGPFADHLRDLDRIHSLGEERSHALALHLLDATARLAAALLPHSEVVTEIDDLPHVWSRSRIPILAPRRFLEADDLRPDPLPHAWTTTTDSIAARVASRLGAAEMILLKSCQVSPEPENWPTAVALGLVDPEFPRAGATIPVIRMIHFRNEVLL